MSRARILADYVAGGTTAAEFDYMDGVTSNVQTQMDLKAPITNAALVTPNLGTPSAGVMTNVTGIPAAQVSGVLPVGVTGGSGLDASNLGITHASKWRVTSSPQGTHTPLSSNLEEADTDGRGILGASMTQSSGVFSFPVTGIWYITFAVEWYYNGYSRYLHNIIQTTVNDSTYDAAARGTCFIQITGSNHTYSDALCNFIFDVTNVSTHKVRFCTDAGNGSVFIASASDLDRTSMSFIRIGDT